MLLRHSGVEEKISLYYKQKREIEYNKEIEKEIDDAQNELSNENYQLDVLEKDKDLYWSNESVGN